MLILQYKDGLIHKKGNSMVLRLFCTNLSNVIYIVHMMCLSDTVLVPDVGGQEPKGSSVYFKCLLNMFDVIKSRQ